MIGAQMRSEGLAAARRQVRRALPLGAAGTPRVQREGSTAISSLLLVNVRAHAGRAAVLPTR
jgi:hypothetical protein